MPSIASQIAQALGPLPAPQCMITGDHRLASCFDVAGLATASVAAATAEAGAITGARGMCVDARRAQLWFGMTLRPDGWSIPSAWDPIAGDYPAADGWIKLHTNAPHHRAAALSVLGCAPTRDAVAAAVADRNGTSLETDIVAAQGCAAALRSTEEWAVHPQGQAVSQEPLIAWDEQGQAEQTEIRDLKDLNVLDLTRVLAGPVATRFLAGVGARVLRIDPPHWDEPGVVPEVTLGKRCAGLDLTKAKDRATFDTLLEGADVVVHGYRTGALDALGYDMDRRQALSGGHIDVCLNAYGHSGPWAGRRGFDSLVQMTCGIAHLGQTIARADRPVPLPVQALDHATGYLMAAAVLRALRVRDTTGQILSARLSLARTAQLLMSQGLWPFDGTLDAADDADFDPAVEHTDWGPAHRIHSPTTFDGSPLRFSEPAGPLRRHAPAW